MQHQPNRNSLRMGRSLMNRAERFSHDGQRFLASTHPAHAICSRTPNSRRGLRKTLFIVVLMSRGSR
jgi:hypothetical protein